MGEPYANASVAFWDCQSGEWVSIQIKSNATWTPVRQRQLRHDLCCRLCIVVPLAFCASTVRTKCVNTLSIPGSGLNCTEQHSFIRTSFTERDDPVILPFFWFGLFWTDWWPWFKIPGGIVKDGTIIYFLYVNDDNICGECMYTCTLSCMNTYTLSKLSHDTWTNIWIHEYSLLGRRCRPRHMID